MENVTTAARKDIKKPTVGSYRRMHQKFRVGTRTRIKMKIRKQGLSKSLQFEQTVSHINPPTPWHPEQGAPILTTTQTRSPLMPPHTFQSTGGEHGATFRAPEPSTKRE